MTQTTTAHPDEARGSSDFVRVTRGALTFLSGTGLGVLSGAVTIIVLTRTLGVDGYGRLALALAVMTLVQTVSTLGLPAGVSRLLAYARGRGDEEDATRLLKASIFVGVGSALLAIAALWALIAFGAIDALGVSEILAVASPLLLAAGLRPCLHGALRAFQDLKSLFIASVVTPLLDVAAVVGLAVVGVRGAVWYALSLTAAVYAEVLMLAYLVRRRRTFGSLFATTWVDVRSVVSFSVPFVFVGFMFLAMQQADVILLGAFHPSATVGLYTPVMRLGHIVDRLIAAFPLLYVPIATGYVARSNLEELRNLYLQVTKWAYAAAFPIILVVIVGPATILPLLFGAPYEAMASESRVIGLGYWATLMTGLNGVTFGVLGLQRRAARASVLAILVNLSIGVLLIPRYGAMGAAWTNTIAYVFMNTLFCWMLFKHSRITPFRRDTGTLFAYSALLVLVGYAAARLLSLESGAGGLVLLGVLCVAWLAGTMRFKSFQLDWREVREAFLLRKASARKGDAKAPTGAVPEHSRTRPLGPVVPDSPPPVFPLFVGRGRSGTTLVRAIFDSHPEIAVPPESPFLVGTARKRRYYEARGTFDHGHFLDDVVTHPRFPLWGLPEAEVRREISAAEPAAYSDAVRALYGMYARAKGKLRYADKSPRTTGAVPLLAELFPESKFVHIVRDGRDVALSHLEVPFGPSNLVQAASEWRREVGRCRRAGVALGPRRYIEIHYEDLVADAERVVRQICEFIELEFDEPMLRYFERADEVIGSTPAPYAHDRLLLPPTSGLRDWRREMSPEDAATFDVIAGPLLEELGYESRRRRVPVGPRMRAHMDHLGEVLPWYLHRWRNRATPQRILQRLLKEVR